MRREQIIIPNREKLADAREKAIQQRKKLEKGRRKAKVLGEMEITKKLLEQTAKELEMEQAARTAEQRKGIARIMKTRITI